MKEETYIGIDQYGHLYYLGKTAHPRKALLNYLGRKSCTKMQYAYDEGIRHVGYVVAGLWITLYTLTQMKNKD